MGAEAAPSPAAQAQAAAVFGALEAAGGAGLAALSGRLLTGATVAVRWSCSAEA
jgi:hypothetical protein